MKNFEIPEFWLLHTSQPHLLAPFSQAVSEKVWHKPPALKPGEEIDLAENPLFRVRRAWPLRACGSKSPTQKLLERKGIKFTLKIWLPSELGVQKFFHFVAGTHRHRHRHTDTPIWIPLHPLGKFFSPFYAREDGKLQTLQNSKISSFLPREQ